MAELYLPVGEAVASLAVTEKYVGWGRGREGGSSTGDELYIQELRRQCSFSSLWTRCLCPDIILISDLDTDVGPKICGD